MRAIFSPASDERTLLYPTCRIDRSMQQRGSRSSEV